MFAPPPRASNWRALPVCSDLLPEHRDVSVWFRLEQLKSIDLMGQQFEMQLVFSVRWEEDRAANMRPTEDALQWGAEHFKWDPQVAWSNQLSENTDIREEWYNVFCEHLEITPSQYRRIHPRPERVSVRMFRRQSVVFSDMMLLRKFPLDTQRLTMTLTTTWDESQVKLRFCKGKIRRSITSMLKDNSFLQDYSLTAPECVDHLMNQIVHCSTSPELKTLSETSWSTTGKQYSRVHIAPHASRNSVPYFYSVFVMQFVLTCLAFCTFRVPPGDLGKRLDIDMTLVLASVAFKSTVQDRIPSVPYLTWLEKYVLVNFLLLSAICVEHFFASTLDDATCGPGFTMSRGCEELPILCFVVIWVVVNAAFTIQALLFRHDRRKQCEDIEEAWAHFSHSEEPTNCDGRSASSLGEDASAPLV